MLEIAYFQFYEGDSHIYNYVCTIDVHLLVEDSEGLEYFSSWK